MACRKYSLTNTGTTAVNFNYRRCDDSMWEYQVNLDPNQTKNIWLLNDTYSTPLFFNSQILLIDDGAFPPIPNITPSATPTLTPTETPIPSITPSVTPTLTPTPTDTGSYLLQENLFNILQEDGFKINIT